MTKCEEISREAVRLIAERHGLSLVLLFGSVASGVNRPDSDVDIGVRFADRSFDLRRIVAVQSDFEEALPGSRIDLASIDRADPFFLKQIAGNCSTLFERHGETDRFRRYAFKRYQDHAPYLRMEREFAERYAGRVGFMIDRELVTRKVVLIAKDIEALRTVVGGGKDAYLADFRNEVLAERYLERSITRMIDINFHLIVGADQPPRDYHESFTELGRMGILEPAFAARIAQSAGLRNRIVHEYDDIDPDRFFEAASAALRDIPSYIKAIVDAQR